MSRLTERGQLVHLLGGLGSLKVSSLVPTIKNNENKVAFSILLSDLFPKVPNYFLYLGSSSLSWEACLYFTPKLCGLQGALGGYLKGVGSGL